MSFFTGAFLRDRTRGALLRSCVLVLLAAVIFCVAVSASWAQTASYPRLTIDTNKENYNLLPYVRVLKETQKPLNAKEALSIFRAGRLPESISSGLARIVGETHWLSFEIVNRSAVDSWVLSFGDQNHGRFGLPQDISIYNATTGEILVDLRGSEVGHNQRPGNLMDNAVSLSIKRGETVSVLMRMTPNNYTPLIFPLNLESAQQHLVHSDAWNWDPRSFELLLILMLGFYAASIVLRRDFSLGLFAGFILLQYLAYSLENQAFYGGDGYTGLLKPLLMSASAVLGLFVAKEFLGIDRESTAQNRLFMAVGVVSVISSIIGLFVMPPASLIGILLTFLPLLIVPLVVLIASLGMMQKHTYGILLFAAGWIVAFACNIITLTAVMSFVAATEFKVFAIWGGVFLQNAYFVLAVTMRQMTDDRESYHTAIEAEEDGKAVKVLNRSKVEAENNRLLKLIRHERAVMNELREREIEQSTETRRARESAEEANRAKSAFLAVISHEIRTPMTGVLGMARLLMQEQLTKKQKDYAVTIKDSGEAMVSLLNDILDFEKIESNNLDLEEIDFDLVRLLNGVVTLMNGHATAKNIKLEHDIDPAVPNIVIGDSVRLRQILLNLVGNAIKFTEAGGVTLIVKRQQDAAHKGTNKQKILFAIKDTGIGISPEAKKNLFNPFSQADSSITRKFGGTGLGLAISQRLVEAMGSRIEIDSVEGQGSKFFFSVAMEAGDEQRAEDTENADAGSSEGKTPDKVMSILIVEDNEVNQKLLTELLNRMGHKSKVAGSGEEGLERLRENDFDMILMDVHLPGISGMGTTKTIRTFEDRTKAAIPIVALTGNIANEDIAACYAANMNAYISKPIDPQILEKTIDKIAKGKFDNPVELQDVSKIVAESNVNAVPDVPDNNTVEEQAPSKIFRASEESDLLNPPEPEDAEEKDADEGGEDDGKDDDTSSLQALAMNLENFNFDEDDFDLEEDSFAAAIEIGEANDKNKVNGYETTDILDPSVLNNLRLAIGHDKLEDMVSEMFMKLDELSQSLRKASNEKDREAFLARTHELKGMSGNFGLQQIRVLLAETEAAFKDGKEIDLNEMLSKLAVAEDAAKSALQRWVGASAEL